MGGSRRHRYATPRVIEHTHRGQCLLPFFPRRVCPRKPRRRRQHQKKARRKQFQDNPQVTRCHRQLNATRQTESNNHSKRIRKAATPLTRERERDKKRRGADAQSRCDEDLTKSNENANTRHIRHTHTNTNTYTRRQTRASNNVEVREDKHR